MNTIAHISDIHIPVMPDVGPRDLAGKRLTGWINWKLRRHAKMSLDSLNNLAQDLRLKRPDFMAVTGDLVNLGLMREAEFAAQWLKALGPPERIGIIPGNHDAYVQGAREQSRRIYGAYATGETLDEAAYPFVRRVGDVAIVGCSSAVATPPFCAAGYFDQPQADRLGKCLDILGDAGFFRIVMIHHPPFERAPWRQRLYGARRFRDIVATHGAEMVLHGHTHLSTISSIPGPSDPVPLIGVASAAMRPGGMDAPARYNLFQIGRAGNGWACTMREFGYQRIGDDIVQRLQMRII